MPSFVFVGHGKYKTRMSAYGLTVKAWRSAIRSASKAARPPCEARRAITERMTF